uniref:WAP domain-containing protein n=1 Tax=Naja naja TaxID=35670 RepID=A0A8C6X122_NAJNA
NSLASERVNNTTLALLCGGSRPMEQTKNKYIPQTPGMFSFSVKPGDCPRAAPNFILPCVQRCESDEDCEGKQKCCLFACNVRCMDPV